jgi:hypothetical protein
LRIALASGGTPRYNQTNMKSNFSQRLQRQIKSKQKPGSAKSYELHHRTRNYIHAALKRAQDAVSRLGYHLGVVTDTGSLVSAKLFWATTDRDYTKSKKDLEGEYGFPICLQISVTDAKGVTIYSHRNSGGTATIVSSDQGKAVEDAIYAELETQILAGVDFLAQARNRFR